MRRQAGRTHNKLAKGKAVFRRRARDVELSPGDRRIAKKLLND